MTSVLTTTRDEALYERAATAYLDLMDEGKTRPRIADIADVLAGRHPDEYGASYREAILERLKNTEFDRYLADRRKRHLIERLAPRMLAAEMGSRVGAKALELLDRQLNEGYDIRPKDLVEIAKLGFALSEKVDKDLEEVTGSNNLTINMEFKQLLLGLPPERRMAVAQEFTRRMVTGGTLEDADN
jgi:hypothetical protein